MAERATGGRDDLFGVGLSPDGVRVVAGAYRRAARFGDQIVGTQHLLSALLEHDTTPVGAVFAAATRSAGALPGLVHARRSDTWRHLDDDPHPIGPDVLPDQIGGIDAAMREAEWRARRTLKKDLAAAPLHASGALIAVVRHAVRRSRPTALGAGTGTGSVHLALALLDVPGSRAGEALLAEGINTDAARGELLALFEQDLPTGPLPESVALLRDCGVLDCGVLDCGVLGGRGRLPTRLLVNGLLSRASGLGSPVPFAVRREAIRQAVRCGRPRVQPVDLLLAVLALDDELVARNWQLTADLRPANRGADALRAAGAGLAALARAAAEDPPRLVIGALPLAREAEQVFLGATREAREQGPAGVGTGHLVGGLLADPGGGPARVLAATGVDRMRVLAAVVLDGAR